MIAARAQDRIIGCALPISMSGEAECLCLSWTDSLLRAFEMKQN